MSNEVTTLQQIQNAVGSLALSSKALAESLGVMQTTIVDLGKRMMRSEEGISSLREDFEAEKARNRDRERIDADEVENITQAIKNRVTDLLKDVDRFDKFGSFTAKCRCDANRFSYYRGKNAVDTKRIYYRELLEYIGKWTPEGYGGVAGYINHLDSIQNRK